MVTQVGDHPRYSAFIQTLDQTYGQTTIDRFPLQYKYKMMVVWVVCTVSVLVCMLVIIPQFFDFNDAKGNRSHLVSRKRHLHAERIIAVLGAQEACLVALHSAGNHWRRHRSCTAVGVVELWRGEFEPIVPFAESKTLVDHHSQSIRNQN